MQCGKGTVLQVGLRHVMPSDWSGKGGGRVKSLLQIADEPSESERLLSVYAPLAAPTHAAAVAAAHF